MEMAYLVIQDKELDIVAIIDNETKIRIFGYQVIGIEEINKYTHDFLLVTKELGTYTTQQIADAIKIVDIRL